jgi:hypothetical protein
MSKTLSNTAKADLSKSSNFVAAYSNQGTVTGRFSSTDPTKSGLVAVTKRPKRTAQQRLVDNYAAFQANATILAQQEAEARREANAPYDHGSFNVFKTMNMITGSKDVDLPVWRIVFKRDPAQPPHKDNLCTVFVTNAHLNKGEFCIFKEQDPKSGTLNYLCGNVYIGKGKRPALRYVRAAVKAFIRSNGATNLYEVQRDRRIVRGEERAKLKRSMEKVQDDAKARFDAAKEAVRIPA